MKHDQFLSRRSIKLLALFGLALFLVAIFLGAVFRTLKSERRLPPRTSVIHDRALRGAIISRDLYTLSRSTKIYQATVHAKSIVPGKKELLIRLFSIYSDRNESEIRRAFLDRNGHPKTGYVVLDKSLDASRAVSLRSLAYQLRRMHVFRAFKNSRGIEVLYGLDITENGENRDFPLGDTLTPALGYIRAKNVGRYREVFGIKGLEKRYEKYLGRCRDGLVRGKRDVIGTIIRNKNSRMVSRKDGYNIYLNIPLSLQKRVEKTLDFMKDETGAKEIIAAVMESGSGKLLALASSERYDPAHITQEDIPKLNAKFTEYLYEPGSVIKPITLSIAIEHRKVAPGTWFRIYGGRLKIGSHYTITDDETFESLTATDIIVHSSNVGISQIAWELSGEEFYRGLTAFGFSKRSGIDLSRELPGKIKSAHLLENRLHRANQAYGYGMQATFIQLLKAYSAYNNNGITVTPMIVDYLESGDGHKYHLGNYEKYHRAISAETADTMKKILEKVVFEGTGTAARYPGLEIGGKTGTAHIAEHGHYVKKYNSSFFGFANDDKNHRYTIGVLVIEAEKYRKYFASRSAVPTFRKIVENMVELGYLEPNLTPAQRLELEAREKKRREAAHRKRMERTRRIKELLKRQREEMKRRRREEKRKRRSAPPRHHMPNKFPKSFRTEPVSYDALPDMF
jgi:cell division protein FtsI (penicillin-binding protein 3)